jgi:hypothetical protein
VPHPGTEQRRDARAIGAVIEAVGFMAPVWQPDQHVGERPAAVTSDSSDGTDFAAEVAALERLARWYRRPASARLLRRWLAEGGEAEATPAQRKAS